MKWPVSGRKKIHRLITPVYLLLYLSDLIFLQDGDEQFNSLEFSDAFHLDYAVLKYLLFANWFINNIVIMVCITSSIIITHVSRTG
ncbi:MAG: hypothetical protein OXC57_15400 [Rhodobacteraceae bacterium]|nr:hypothetical protein [Paracoccaceae bacterium]